MVTFTGNTVCDTDVSYWPSTGTLGFDFWVRCITITRKLPHVQLLDTSIFP